MIIKNIISISWNYINTEIDYRDKLVLSKSDIDRFVNFANKQSNIIEFNILSTCNRIEYYFIATKLDIVEDWLMNYYNDILNKNIDFKLIKPSIIKGYFAVQHLFQVAAGLKSLIVGERQILKQVDSASSSVLDRYGASSYLYEIFKEAVICSSLMHEQIQIGNKKNSISYQAINKSVELVEKLKIQKVVVIGAGETASMAAKHLIDMGVTKISIANRSIVEGLALAKELNIKFIKLSHLNKQLKDIDIIVAATSSMDYLINYKDVFNCSRNRKKYIFIDLGNPRNVDPLIRRISGVTLIDIDSLNYKQHKISKAQKDKIILAKKNIQEYINNFFQNWNRKSILDGLVISNKAKYIDS